MDRFHYLEDTRVFFKGANSSNVYELEIIAGGVTFSQTFTEENFSTKTVHAPTNFVQHGVFRKASPVNFEFTVPLLTTGHPMFEYLVNINTSQTLDTFNLWFIEKNKVFSIEKCVLTGGVFNAARGAPLTLGITGQGTRLRATEEADIAVKDRVVTFTEATAQGAPTFAYSDIAEYAGSKIYLSKVYSTDNTTETLSSGKIVNAVEGSYDIISANMELQNNITWIPYETVQQGLKAGGAAANTDNLHFPSNFVVTGRVLAGNTRLAMRSDTSINTFKNTTTDGFNQKIAEGSTWRNAFLHETTAGDHGVQYFNSTGETNYSARVTPGPFYTLDIDWRHASNTLSLQNYLTFKTA